MTDYPSLFLGVMAVALAIMAIVQIGLIVVALRVARQLTTTASQLQQEVRPLIAEATAVTQKASAIADEASRVAGLATVQVERFDQMMASTASRVDDTLATVQRVMSGPVGQGAALLSGFRAAAAVIRDWRTDRRRSSGPTSHDDEDALFVG